MRASGDEELSSKKWRMRSSRAALLRAEHHFEKVDKTIDTVSANNVLKIPQPLGVCSRHTF